MYALALRNAQLRLEAPGYIRLRHLIDENMQAKFKYVMYGGLLSTLSLVIVAVVTSTMFVIICTSIALVALVLDTVVTVRGNLPVNNVINSWTTEQYPSDWEKVRVKWLQLFRTRQVLNIAGFIALIAGAVFR